MTTKITLKCIKANGDSFKQDMLYEATRGIYGDNTVKSAGGYSYNLNKKLKHVSSHGEYEFIIC